MFFDSKSWAFNYNYIKFMCVNITNGQAIYKFNKNYEILKYFFSSNSEKFVSGFHRVCVKLKFIDQLTDSFQNNIQIPQQFANDKTASIPIVYNPCTTNEWICVESAQFVV